MAPWLWADRLNAHVWGLNPVTEYPSHRFHAVQVCVPLPPWAVRAGARKEIYFNPSETNVAIVTCGGLCPGLNDVVQGLVRKLEDYGVPEGNILGIRCMAADLMTWSSIGFSIHLVIKSA